ncbi:MAG: hypothetical protein MJZ23_03305 [Paludibacteraceae bacterium]|nr:hypothetical protein [Paludibacteraceae bacterium]
MIKKELNETAEIEFIQLSEEVIFTSDPIPIEECKRARNISDWEEEDW